MNCLILAAGQGSRLSCHHEPKPLHSIRWLDSGAIAFGYVPDCLRSRINEYPRPTSPTRFSAADARVAARPQSAMNSFARRPRVPTTIKTKAINLNDPVVVPKMHPPAVQRYGSGAAICRRLHPACSAIHGFGCLPTLPHS